MNQAGNFKITPEQQAEIRRLYAEGTRSAHGISRSIGISEPTVRRCMGRLGLAVRPALVPWTPAEDDTLCRLYVPGDYAQTVADALAAEGRQRSPKAVRQRAKMLGLTGKTYAVRARYAAEERGEAPARPEGSDEARDAAFVRKVLVEAKRLGLWRAAA